MFGRRPSVTSRRGVVAAAHPLAAQAGARILSNGGNAFDAAVATAAALNVVEPYMSGLAGMGTAMVYVAAERRVRCLDFTPAVPLKFDSIARRYDDLTRGPHGVGPPASLAGWMKLLDTYGTRTTAELFADAIDLARGGFPVSEGNAHMIGGRLNDIAEIFPGWSEIFLDNDEEPGAGWMLHQHDLADTYEALVSEGPDYLYHGALGQALVNEIQALGGALAMEDLAAVEARWQDPIRIAYRDLEVNGAPPPSEGFQMLMTLGLVSHLDIGALERNGPEHLDAMIRAIRLSSRVRFRHANAPIEIVEEILGDENLDRLRGLLDSSEAISGPTEQIGAAPAPGSMPDPMLEHTTSFSVMDAEGNAVCLTQSLGAGFGSGIVVQGHGVLTNDLLRWGDLNPLSPNHLYPGAPLSLPIAPTITLRDGEPVLALGTPGSYGICQTQPQALVQHVDFGLDVQAAIEAPRMRLMDGDLVLVESRIDQSVIDALVARGHGAEATDPWTMAVGGMQGASRNPATGALQGGADPRRDGYAIGV